LIFNMLYCIIILPIGFALKENDPDCVARFTLGVFKGLGITGLLKI
jgi:hypothetical protein